VHRDDRDAVGGKVTAAPAGEHLKREPVTHSLHQNDHLRPPVEGRIRGHAGHASRRGPHAYPYISAVDERLDPVKDCLDAEHEFRPLIEAGGVVADGC
jgi:hypothetical protein